MSSISRQIASWVANLRYEDLPPTVVDRAKGVTLHALASALLGHDMPENPASIAHDAGGGSWRCGGCQSAG